MLTERGMGERDDDGLNSLCRNNRVIPVRRSYSTG